MRTGIITIHKSEVNYGASLQSYALYKTISLLGHDCEVIDLLRPCHDAYIGGKGIKPSIRKLIRSVRSRVGRRGASENKSHVFEKTKKFSQFNGELKYSLEYRCPKELYKNPPVCDVYISGSDQIWNPNMPFENKPYFLTFAPKGAKKISYASSFGVNHLEPDIEKVYSQWLTTYSALSVRESSGRKIINDLTGKDASVVLDPTFLMSSVAWQKMAAPPPVDEDFLFVYTLHLNMPMINYAERIAAVMGLTPILIMSSNESTAALQIRSIADAGPRDWLGMLANAKMVITDSYHGTIFSILFGVPFFTYFDPGNVQNNVSDRIVTLSNTLSFEERLLKPDFSHPPEELLHYPLNHVDRLKAVESEREKSIEFLRTALE